VGLAIGEGELRAVVVRGGRVAAATAAGLAPGEPLAGAVAALLAALPAPRLPRPRVTVAIGPSLAQTRRLTGLPPLDDPRLAAQLVREGAGRFFLRNGRPLTTTGVRLEEPGVAWCAALDEEAVREAAAGVRGAGLRVEGFVPAVAALAHAFGDGRTRWHDGPTVSRVELAGGALVAVRRLPGAAGRDEDVDDTPLAGPLQAVGDRARDFADAYGAAVLPASEALVHRPAPSGRVAGWRLAAAGAAAVLALAAMFVLPPLKVARAAHRAAARVAAAGPSLRAAAEGRAALGEATAALDQAGGFGEARWSATRLLAELARRLPPGTALVSLHADTTAGMAIALAPRATDVLGALEKVEGVRRVEIAGAVTREGAAGREVERVTLRFSFDPRARAAADARTPGGGR